MDVPLKKPVWVLRDKLIVYRYKVDASVLKTYLQRHKLGFAANIRAIR